MRKILIGLSFLLLFSVLSSVAAGYTYTGSDGCSYTQFDKDEIINYYSVLDWWCRFSSIRNNSCQGWTIPRQQVFKVLMRHDDLACSQRLIDLNTGEVIADGGDDYDTIDRTHMYHTLLYTCQVKGTPHNQNIVIPVYPGGDICVWTYWYSCVKKQSWTNLMINGYMNQGLGRDSDGYGNYTLPPDAIMNGG